MAGMFLRSWTHAAAYAAGVAALALAACESAPAQTPGVSSPQTGCTEFGAPTGASAAVASQCSDRADDSDILGREAALAYFHAAAAYNDMGRHADAARMLGRSYDELSTNDGWLTTLPSGLSEKAEADWVAQRRGFRLGRMIEFAEAYQGLAAGFGTAGATSSSPLCTSRSDCLTKAINRLSEGQTLAAQLAGSATSPRSAVHDRYFLLLGELHEARNTAADIEAAISAYQKVASSPLGGSAASAARANLSAMTTRLGQDASRRLTASDTAQAIRYFTIASEADAANSDAVLGLAQLYMRLGMESNDVAQLQKAEAAYTDVLSTASSDARKAAAYSGRGAVRDELANLLGTSREGAIEDYEAASRLANSADAFIVLASACKDREDWACADANYTKGVAALKTDSASGPALSEALIAQASVRSQMPQYAPGDVRSLLQQAVNAAPASAGAVMALARHDMENGNWAQAETGFKRLVGMNTAGTGADKAEAYSQLSGLAASRPGGSLSQAISHADEAVKLDSANTAYRREACLARILAGATNVTKSENASAYALGVGAEASLLQAMFEMRKAQYAGTNGAAQIRRGARDNIDRALGMVEAGQTTDFDWPSASSLAPVKTKAVLLYMKEATLACGGNYSFNLPDVDGLTQDDYTAARNFLEFYKSRLCT